MYNFLIKYILDINFLNFNMNACTRTGPCPQHIAWGPSLISFFSMGSKHGDLGLEMFNGRSGSIRNGHEIV